MQTPHISRPELALVTGASRGLGLALSHELARRGVAVVMVARDPDRLREARDRVAADAAANVYALPADVGDVEQARALPAKAAGLTGQAVTLVVQNASTLGPLPMPLLADLGPEAFARVLDVNLVGPFAIAQGALGNMVLHDHGQLVFISSDAAVSAFPHWGAYGTSKAASDQLARSFAAELEGTGVRVRAVDPGEMNTDMHRDAIPDADPATLRDPRAVARRLVDDLLSVVDRPVRYTVALDGGER